MNNDANFELAVQKILMKEAFREERAQIKTRLRREKDGLEHKAFTTERDLKKACEVASQAWCRPFTSLPMGKLPPELRRMIFDHISTIQNPRRVLGFQTRHQCRPYQADDCDSICATVCDMALPSNLFLVHESWVDEAFAVEAAATLYRTTLVRLQNAKDISRILNEDTLGTKCIPRDHITQIEVEISPRWLDLLLSGRVYGSLLRQFIDSLLSLLSIKKLKVVHLVFRIGPRSDISLFPYFGDLLTPVIHGLYSMSAEVFWCSNRPYADDFRMFQMLERDYTQPLDQMMQNITGLEDYRAGWALL